MAGPKALARLLQVLEIEEEQAKIALESAVADHRLLEQRLNAAVERNRSGRRLIQASAASGDLTDRWAGLEESRLAGGHADRLKPMIKEAEVLVANRRQVYMAKRVERRQAQTLIEEAKAREAVEAARRSQRGLDDWYLNQLNRTGRQTKPASGQSDDLPGVQSAIPAKS